MNNENKYSQNDLDIALLKNNDEGILRSMIEIKADIKSQFHLMVGLVLGLYTAVGILAITKLWV
jgi:hypothetical protein